MRSSAICLIFVCTIGVLLGASASADVTIEMKSSLSGIPFLQNFEMFQTMVIRDGYFISTSEAEIGIPDTTIRTKSTVWIDMLTRDIDFCEWEDSTCTNINFSDVEAILGTDMAQKAIDSLTFILDSIEKFFSLDKLTMDMTDNKQTIDGYKCREIIFGMEGSVTVPVEKLPGSFKFMLNGSSWVTSDFPNYDEYRKVMTSFQTTFLSQKFEDLLGNIMSHFGVGEEYLEKYKEYTLFVSVQNAINITVELWSPGMTVPSMSFNLRFNSVLDNLSTDKVPDQVFSTPEGFQKKDLNLFDLF
jgi:hypothetical protein